MTNQQLQQDARALGADHSDWADIEDVLGKYEEFVRQRKTDRVYRAGRTGFFLLLNGFLFLAYALMAVEQAGENLPPTKLPYLSFFGIAVCFLWWTLVRLSYTVWNENKGPETHARRDLLRQAVLMRLYWLLDRIPLHDETPPKGVAAALPLAFMAIHFFLGIFLAAIVA